MLRYLIPRWNFERKKKGRRVGVSLTLHWAQWLWALFLMPMNSGQKWSRNKTPLKLNMSKWGFVCLFVCCFLFMETKHLEAGRINRRAKIYTYNLKEVETFRLHPEVQSGSSLHKMREFASLPEAVFCKHFLTMLARHISRAQHHAACH